MRTVIAKAIARGKHMDIYEDLAAQLGEEQGAVATSPALEEAQEAYDVWVDRMDTTSVPGQTGLQLVGPQVGVRGSEMAGAPATGLTVAGPASIIRETIIPPLPCPSDVF